jgi:hypothetical protein
VLAAGALQTDAFDTVRRGSRALRIGAARPGRAAEPATIPSAPRAATGSALRAADQRGSAVGVSATLVGWNTHATAVAGARRAPAAATAATADAVAEPLAAPRTGLVV